MSGGDNFGLFCPGGGRFGYPGMSFSISSVGWVRIFSGTTHLQKMKNVKIKFRHHGIVHTVLYKLPIPLSKWVLELSAMALYSISFTLTNKQQ